MRDERELPWLAAPVQALAGWTQGHACLLHGGAGSGLFELALRVAQAWLCEGGHEGGAPGRAPGAALAAGSAAGLKRPCDACVSCHLVATHSHGDLHVVVPEALRVSLGWHAADDDAGPADGESKSKRKPSREIKVDDVRAAIAWAHSSSARGRGKVLVLHPAEALNPTAANALLKTLEEPAGALRLLLCVDDPERLLPTLRSRCQRVRLPTPNRAQALAWLGSQGVGGADGPATLLAAAGDQPLTAQALWAEGLTAALWQDLPRQVQAGDAAALAGLALPRAIGVLLQVCHDTMRMAAGAPPRYFQAASLPAAASLAALSDWRAALVRASRHDEHPWNGPLLVESLVLQGRAAMAHRPRAASGRLATLRL
jgi:DNA polymerase-3 subunit delta'